MGYETSKFGNGILVGSGGNVTSNVTNFFGPRRSGGTTGVLEVDGMIEQLVINLDGALINDNSGKLVTTYLPAGAIIRDVWYDGETAFALGGTSPTILIGTSGSEVTNGFVISEAVGESTNTARLTSTLTGTWAVNTPIQARTAIGIALGGTSPTIDRNGKARVTIEFIRPNNVRLG